MAAVSYFRGGWHSRPSQKRVDFIKEAKAFEDLNVNPFEIQVFGHRITDAKQVVQRCCDGTGADVAVDEVWRGRCGVDAGNRRIHFHASDIGLGARF